MSACRHGHSQQGGLPVPYRLPMLIAGFIALALGVLAGLGRLGFGVPLPSAGLLALHGPLMACGFFGTLISLERAAALGRRWAYLAPLLAAVAVLALIAGLPAIYTAALFSLASVMLVLASLTVVLAQRALFTGTLLLGAVSWLIGNLLWLAGAALSAVVPWWAGFLVLTIAGERLELSRFLPPSRTAQRLFAAIVAALVAGLALAAYGAHATLLSAAAFLALTAWLVRYDIARRTVKDRGLTRFIAVCLLSAYAWLGIGSVIALASGGLFSGPAYDATLHAVFLGFVFSMVFGHAPIIFPAVTRLAIHYHPVFYLHLALLHLSLALRVAGDLAGVGEWRSLGAMLNAVTLALFVLNTVAGIVRARRRPEG
jgi:hypothetical protein